MLSTHKWFLTSYHHHTLSCRICLTYVEIKTEVQSWHYSTLCQSPLGALTHCLESTRSLSADVLLGWETNRSMLFRQVPPKPVAGGTTSLKIHWLYHAPRSSSSSDWTTSSWRIGNSAGNMASWSLVTSSGKEGIISSSPIPSCMLMISFSVCTLCWDWAITMAWFRITHGTERWRDVIIGKWSRMKEVCMRGLCISAYSKRLTCVSRGNGSVPNICSDNIQVVTERYWRLFQQEVMGSLWIPPARCTWVTWDTRWRSSFSWFLSGKCARGNTGRSISLVGMERKVVVTEIQAGIGTIST